MKAIRHLFLLLFVAGALASCHKGYVYAERLAYYISFSFRDASGNDLVAPMVEGGMINPDKYSVDIVLAYKEQEDTFARPYHFRAFYDNQSGDGYWYLGCNLITPAKEFGLQQSIIYKIACYPIFNDDNSHEVVTYWDFSYEDIHPPLDNDKFPECYGVIFEGQKILPVRKRTMYSGSTYHHFVDIVLDN